MDRIFIDGLRLDCRVGVTEEERRLSQKVLVDVSLFLDLRRPAASGRIQDTADYREAKSLFSRFASEGEFRLLESLAEGIASIALERLGAERVSVRVRKEKYSADPSIGVEIERDRGLGPR
jgi:7,8-dihydroneopterin aldolase/epimerase/oxygenase